MRLADAHKVSTGAGVRIAVLDTGVDASHPLLASRLLRGYDFVDGDLNPAEEGGRDDLGFGHGTHVAGIIATAAPGAKIVPIRVLDRNGEGNAWVLAEAVLFVIDPDGNPTTDDGAHVINLSLGTPQRTEIFDTISHLASCSFPAVPDPLEPENDISDPGYNADKERCKYSRGAVVVAAAGNDASRRREFPAGEGAFGCGDREQPAWTPGRVQQFRFLGSSGGAGRKHHQQRTGYLYCRERRVGPLLRHLERNLDGRGLGLGDRGIVARPPARTQPGRRGEPIDRLHLVAARRRRCRSTRPRGRSAQSRFRPRGTPAEPPGSQVTKLGMSLCPALKQQRYNRAQCGQPTGSTET